MENGQNNVVATEIATNGGTAAEQPKVVKTGRVLPTVTKTAQSKKEDKISARKVLAEDDVATRNFELLSENRMKSTFTVRLNEKSKERVLVESVFDYSGLTRAELLELASASVRITVQGKMRAMGADAMKGNAFGVVNVKADIVDAARNARTSVDPVTAAIRALVRATGMDEAAARKVVENNTPKQK